MAQEHPFSKIYAALQSWVWRRRLQGRKTLVAIFLMLALLFGVLFMWTLHFPLWMWLALGAFNLLLLWVNYRPQGMPLAALAFWLESTFLPWVLVLSLPSPPKVAYILLYHSPLLVLSFLALYLRWPWNLVGTLGHFLLFWAASFMVSRLRYVQVEWAFQLGLLAVDLAFVVMEVLWEQFVRRSREIRNLYEQLRRQERFLHSIIDAVDGPFYVIEPGTYRVVLANRAARQYGIQTDGSAVTCYALTHGRETPCTGKEHPCPLHHVLEHGQPMVVEHLHYRPDGTPYVAEVHAFPIKDEAGRVQYMVEYSLDITARKQAEERLRLFQRASEYSAHGILITDTSGTILYVNPAFTRMTGYTPEEAIGQTPRILKSGKHGPEFYRHLWRTIRAGKVWAGEMINRRKDGSLYYEEQTIAPVFDEEGNITHFVAVKQDVTRRKQIEAALHEARQRAEEANRFKTRLLGSLGHDIRTPLSLIFSLSETLLAEETCTSSQKELIRQIVLATSQMQDFAEGLLAYARLEEQGLKIEPRPLDRPTLIQRLEGIYRFIAQQKGLRFSVRWEAPLETVYGDPVWVVRAVGNLVSNAIRYTPEGGEVRVRFWMPNAHQWAVTVADTGPGIPNDVRERLFEPFTTGSNRQSTSMGLGLYIVREVVQAHGGSIEVESAPNRGTRMTLVFPLPEPTTEKRAAYNEAAPPSPS